MSRLTQDGTAEPVSRDQILRHVRGQKNIHFLGSADHEQDWQPYPVDPYSAICDDHTYHTIPFTVVLGAAFMKGHQNTISVREKEGFRPTPELIWVPFSSHITNSATSLKYVTAARTTFCAIRPTADIAPYLEDLR